MRILHVTSHLNFGGVTSYILSVSRLLRQRGHDPLIASGGGKREPQASAIGVRHWHVPLHTSAEFSPQVFWGTERLSRRLAQDPVEILHAHTRVGQVVAHRLSRRHRIPYVTTWHGIYRWNLGRAVLPATGDATIAISGPVHQHLLDDFRVPRERVRLIPNGVDVDHFAAPIDPVVLQTYRERWGLADHRPLIGGMGRFAGGRVKGFDLLLDVAQRLCREIPELDVLIVGDGPRRATLEQQAERQGIRRRVHFVGAVDDVRIPLALMDVFLFPVRWPEGFGLVLIEAMAAGKAVIATRVGAVPEIVRHDRDGWLVPPNDPAALAEGTFRLLSDREAARQLGRQAQARVREAFSLERMVSEIERVYQELLSEREKVHSP